MSRGAKFCLHYDFVDDWMFVIGVQGIEETDKNIVPYVSKEKGLLEQYPEWDDYDE